jgi:hypothetical protein
MGCKYVKDFTFDSASGYTGSSGKTEVKAYMRGGAVRKAPLTAQQPRQTPTNMKPLRTANAKTAMREADTKNVSGASGKISTAGQYAKGGMACASGCKVEMKKGGKTKKAAPKKSAPKKAAAKRKNKAEDAAVEQLLEQMIAQAASTGRVPGVPMQDMGMPGMGGPMQSAPMPAPNARSVPVASQQPLLAMRSGGMTSARQHKMDTVMGEYKRGDLHSGSRSGPVVKNRDQALAIAMSEARKKRA